MQLPLHPKKWMQLWWAPCIHILKKNLHDDIGPFCFVYQNIYEICFITLKRPLVQIQTHLSYIEFAKIWKQKFTCKFSGYIILYFVYVPVSFSGSLFYVYVFFIMYLKLTTAPYSIKSPFSSSEIPEFTTFLRRNLLVVPFSFIVVSSKPTLALVSFVFLPFLFLPYSASWQCINVNPIAPEQKHAILTKRKLLILIRFQEILLFSKHFFCFSYIMVFSQLIHFNI